MKRLSRDASLDGIVECSLTTGCQLRCRYCHQKQPLRSQAVTWETLSEVIEGLVISDAVKRRFALTGGEPLLEWPLVRKAVERLRGLEGPDISISLLTNGLLLDDDKIAFLASNDVEVQVSLDGVREAHDLRVPGAFDRLQLLINRMRREHYSWFRKRVAVGMVLTSGNVVFLARSIAMMLEWGIESIRLAPLLTHDAGWTSQTEAELERQMEGVFETSLGHFRRTGIIPLEVLRRPARPRDARPDRPVCRARAPGRISVGVDGSTAGCTLLLDPEVGGTRAGTVLREWISDPEWPGMRRDRWSAFGPCRDCEFIDECPACPVASANIPGNCDPRRVPDNLCAFTRVVAAARRRFPPMPDAESILKGEDPLPEAMVRLAGAFGLTQEF